MYLLLVPVEPQPSYLLQAKTAHYCFKHENNTRKECVLAGGLLEQRGKIKPGNVHEKRLGLCKLHGRVRVLTVEGHDILLLLSQREVVKGER